MDEDSRIADVADVPADSTLLFTIRDGFDEREAILTKTDGDGSEGENGGKSEGEDESGDEDENTGGDEDGVVAYENYCQHWTDVRLDKGSGATKRDGELVCGKHGALFEDDTGCCTYGPCEGAVLQRVEVAVADGGVFLTDDDYEFVQVGSDKQYDLSSNRSLGFD